MNVQKVGIMITTILIYNYLRGVNSKGENVGERPATTADQWPVVFDINFLCLTHILCFLMISWDDFETNTPRHNV